MDLGTRGGRRAAVAGRAGELSWSRRSCRLQAGGETLLARCPDLGKPTWLTLLSCAGHHAEGAALPAEGPSSASLCSTAAERRLPVQIGGDPTRWGGCCACPRLWLSSNVGIRLCAAGDAFWASLRACGLQHRRIRRAGVGNCVEQHAAGRAASHGHALQQPTFAALDGAGTSSRQGGCGPKRRRLRARQNPTPEVSGGDLPSARGDGAGGLATHRHALPFPFHAVRAHSSAAFRVVFLFIRGVLAGTPGVAACCR